MNEQNYSSKEQQPMSVSTPAEVRYILVSNRERRAIETFYTSKIALRILDAKAQGKKIQLVFQEEQDAFAIDALRAFQKLVND